MQPSQKTLHSIVTLRRYGAGTTDKAAAMMALRRLEDAYGQPIKGAAALFRRGLNMNDESAQKELLFEALSHIIDLVFRRRIKASLWHRVLMLWSPLKEKIIAHGVKTPHISGAGYARAALHGWS